MVHYYTLRRVALFYVKNNNATAVKLKLLNGIEQQI